MKSFILLFLFSLALCGKALTPSSFLSTIDKDRLKSVFESTLSNPSADIPSLHYAILGYKLLEEKKAVVFPKEVCKVLVSKLESDSNPNPNLLGVFQAAVAGVAAGCKLPAPSPKTKQVLEGVVAPGASVSDIYHGVLASVSLGLPIQIEAVATALKSGLKKDDSLVALGQAFHVATHLDVASAKIFFDRVEDAIVQADEVDGKILHFEGGLTLTNLILSGAFKLSEKVGKAPPISKMQVVKFANYFMSRKSVQGVKGGYQLIEGIKTLAENNHASPVAVTLASPATVSDASPVIRIRVTDILGRPLESKISEVSIDSAMRIHDGTVVMAKSKMSPVAGEASLFEINMKAAKPGRGFYKMTISAVSDNEKFVGNIGATLEFKVLSALSIENVEIGAVDTDQSTAPKLAKLNHPSKLGSVLEADHHHKVILKFSLKDKETKEDFKAHQTFVRLTKDNKAEIIFLAEQTGGQQSANYKFELDIGDKAKAFKGNSGIYSMEIVVGDPVVSGLIQWNVADLNLKFPVPEEKQTPAKPKESVAKPEISHLFREPETRPSAMVSKTFTVLCILPILFMFGLWAKVGVNVSAFPFSLSTFGFHFGLAAIFGLYYYFWVQLNMFVTMKYLLMLGVVTFLCGNSMLVKIAEKRKT